MRDENNKLIIYLISGPLGVGKSTASKELAQKIKQCVLIEGDDLLHMFKGESQPSWEERLSLTWNNILALTRNFIQHDLNVVIDFVVEDELDWFCKHISDLNVSLKYVVLRADKDKIIERLRIRGDIHSLERSLFLMSKMEASPSNERYIYDNTLKQPAETVKDIIDDSVYFIFCQST
ncbi:ATP-binding protein [Paenibacillus alkaliterrae]|uniref:AAA family ATPase n=1 Tax=Paenibacillus alkaliterrae TaxID=320909 RepID=UPI001F184029|nr:AAA family ATPase [Paenibacillus alkaliterrae]MCF2939174.1 ATP-binding protein [Paenibacillus alkaliterrae]